MTVLAVQGAKGGVGASLLSVNLGVALSQAGRTLLLDLDPQSGCDDLLLDLAPQHTWMDLLPVAGELQASHLHRACETHVSGLDLLAAPQATAPTAEWDRLPVLLGGLTRHYEWILLDLPSHMAADSWQTMRDLLSSQLLVLTPDPSALRAGTRSLKAAPPGIRARTGLVVNQVSERHPASPQGIAAGLGVDLLCVLPIDARAVGYQINFGVSCVGDSRSHFGRAVLQLAARLVADSNSQTGIKNRSRSFAGGVR